MRTFLLTVFTSALLSACTHFEKAGSSNTETAQAEAECKYEAEKATANGGSGIEYAQVEMGCMKLRGYHLYSN